MHNCIPNFYLGKFVPQCPVASWILPKLPWINHGQSIFPCCELCLSYSFALKEHGQLELQCPSLADSYPEFEFLNKIKDVLIPVSYFSTSLSFACKVFDTCILANFIISMNINYTIKLWLTSTFGFSILLNNISRCRREQYSYSALVLLGVLSFLAVWRRMHNGLFEHGADSSRSRSLVAHRHCSNHSFCCSWETKTLWNE